jgi:hypothetical protein
MAIQPLDLQIMFTQLDTVGKTQAAQKEGLVLQQTLQNIHKQEKTEEHIQAINESQDMGDGAEAVNDRGSRKSAGGDSGGQKEKRKKEEESRLWDPLLGKNLDISG